MGDSGAKVYNMNGTPAGTDGELTKYNFVGTPPNMYEHMPDVGEYRVMTVTVECTAAGHKKKADGSYPAATWAIREAAIGREVDAPSKDDPDQITVDEALDEIENENADQTEEDLVREAEGELAAAEPGNNYDVFQDGSTPDED